MTRYFIDSEFYHDGSRIHPISLAIVKDSESDDEFRYWEFTSQQGPLANSIPKDHFVAKYVLGALTGLNVFRVVEVRKQITEWITEKDKPEFWGYYCDYDWVLFCQLFGAMVDLPPHFPQFCMDLQQEFQRFGSNPGLKPPLPRVAHNALVDAKWNREFYRQIAKYRLPMPMRTL